MKKLLAFDLDDTLAPSKSTLDPCMADLLNELLKTFHICIISGAKYELFERQVLSQITDDPNRLQKLHLLPTSGTRYYSFNADSSDWHINYAEDFSAEQKTKITRALAEGLIESGYAVEKTYGETIEDRESQITLSILGQEVVAELGEEGVRLKKEWDPTGEKKLEIRRIVAPKIPDFEVRAAGATSIDVTMPGVDKGYGMAKLMDATGFVKSDILFFGDKIVDGGNDYSVKQLGVDCVSVECWQDTAYALEGIIGVIK